MLDIVEKLAPDFEHLFKFVYVDDEWGLGQRKLTGVTWDELPSMSISTTEFYSAAFPENDPHDFESVERWLRFVSVKKNLEDQHQENTFALQVKDTTMNQYFFKSLVEATREDFTKQILVEEQDSIVFMYSTQDNNYLQRKAAYQFNLAAASLQLNDDYSDLVPNYVKFYAYDTNVHGFPKGIPAMTPPPEDLYG